MKEQCAACPTRVLANASTQWDALPHLVRLPYRHEAKTGSKSIDRADSRDPALGATSWCSSANDGLHVWLPEAVGPLIRASFVRTLRSRPQRILSGSRPMQQRLVCVEAGQTFPIQRIEVLTPQVSSIHCRLTRGRALVRSQSGPPAVYLRRRGLLWVGWQAATLSRSCHINSRDTSRVTRGHHDTVCPGEIGLSEHGDIP